MKKRFLKKKFFLSLVIYLIFSLINASEWTNWIEYPLDPVYNPGRAYYPSVLYDANKFGDNSAYYKMWFEGNNAMGLAYSEDGINWVTQTLSGLPNIGAHPDVVYDSNGFGGSIYKYKMWYWDPNQSLSTIAAIQFSQSTDGVSWTTPISVTQDATFPLVTGVAGAYFYHLYGPGDVIYNPDATSIPGQPTTYPYVMWFDTSTEGAGPGTSVEQLGLAYSSDGLFWTRYGTEPVLIPSGNSADWDGIYRYQGHLIKVQGMYHLFYSGSNGQPIGSAGNTTAHGIGHASSTDGINWTIDADNPIFYITDGVAWRNNRTYTPTVIYYPFCEYGSCSSCVAKMWFTGANSSDVRAIGYATLPCLPLPTPAAPTNFNGVIRINKFLNRTEFVLQTSWSPSTSDYVSLYRIYRNGVIVANIKAGDPLKFSVCTTSCNSQTFSGYQVAAVNINDIESSRMSLSLLNSCPVFSCK